MMFCADGWLRRRSALAGLVLGLALVLSVAAPAASQEPAEGQGDQAGAGTVEVMLRDGTRMSVTEVRIGRTGIECRIGRDRLHLSWSVLAPWTVYELRQAHLEESNATLTQWVDLAEWCAAYPELHDKTITMLERVLQINANHRRAEGLLGELGYVFHDGLARNREEWERRQREQETPPDTTQRDPGGDDDGANGESGSEADPVPQGPARAPGERLRVSVQLVERIDWAGHAAIDIAATRTAQDVFVEHLQERNIIVTDENPHYIIVGRIDVTCYKNVQFFETSIVAGFTGRATATATRTSDGYEIEIPEATTRLERPNAQAALDGVLQTLGRRLGATTAARLR